MVRADKGHHHDAEQKGDTDGRNGVGVEHLQKLNIRGDHIDQVTFVLALQLGRAQTAECTEHLVTDQCQQFEGNKMVAGLLRITEKAAHQCEDQYGSKNHAKGHRPFWMKDVQHGITAENGDKGGTQVTDEAHGNGKDHIAGQGLYQTYQPGHNFESASFHCASPPLV